MHMTECDQSATSCLELFNLGGVGVVAASIWPAASRFRMNVLDLLALSIFQQQNTSSLNRVQTCFPHTAVTTWLLNMQETGNDRLYFWTNWWFIFTDAKFVADKYLFIYFYWSKKIVLQVVLHIVL